MRFGVNSEDDRSDTGTTVTSSSPTTGSPTVVDKKVGEYQHDVLYQKSTKNRAIPIENQKKNVTTKWHPLDSSSRTVNNDTYQSRLEYTPDHGTINDRDSVKTRDSANMKYSINVSASKSEISTEASPSNYQPKNLAHVSNKRPFQGFSDDVEDELVFTELPTSVETDTYERTHPDAVTPPSTQLSQSANQLEATVWSRIMSDDGSEPVSTGRPLIRDQIESMLVAEGLIVSRLKRQTNDETDAVESGCTGLYILAYFRSLLSLK